MDVSLELYPLRVFCQVMADGSFSDAARSLRLTQPTISQQIAKLESELGVKLFQRVGHDIVPTDAAQELLRFAVPLLEQVSSFEESLTHQRSEPKGLVRYAMPESCQWTSHYRRIMAQIAEFPAVQFQIGIQPNDQIVRRILEGELDFGFIVGEKLAPDLRFEKFSEERYSAVAKSKSALTCLDDPKRICELRLVTYPGYELFLSTWSKSAGLWKAFKAHLSRPAVQIGTLAGAIHAIQEGAGVGIIPTHCVLREISTGELHVWKKPGLDPFNPVYLAKRTAEKLPRRAELVIEMLRKAKTELG